LLLLRQAARVDLLQQRRGDIVQARYVVYVMALMALLLTEDG